MNNTLFPLILCVLFTTIVGAQQVKDSNDISQKKKKNISEIDSVKTAFSEEGIVLQDSLIEKKKAINPLAPSKAAFYSAVLPGLGQIYNRRYWKVPIVYAALGSGISIYLFNNDKYVRFRSAFKSRLAGFNNDEFWNFRNPGGPPPATPDLPTTALQDGQERYQRDRDLALLVTIVIYALNVVDANVDAHLKQFNVDEDLGLDVQPYLEVDPITNKPNYGMAFVINF
ncbi:MAG: DUF5683 domain-containing protein [Maribacter sp.]|nr:DUF5683 domain-containing protein [Maribacter sp.]